MARDFYAGAENSLTMSLSALASWTLPQIGTRASRPIIMTAKVDIVEPAPPPGYVWATFDDAANTTTRWRSGVASLLQPKNGNPNMRKMSVFRSI